jgi:hypothetical protein
MSTPKIPLLSGRPEVCQTRELIVSIRCRACAKPVTLVVGEDPGSDSLACAWACPWCDESFQLPMPHRTVLALAGDAHSPY